MGGLEGQFFSNGEQGWRSLPTPVARVRFPDLVSHVGLVCCWFSSLLQGFFSRFSGFRPSTKNDTPNFNLTWNLWMKNHSVDVPLLNSIYFFFGLF